MYTDVILKKHALEPIYFDSNKLQEDHDGPISLTWANRFAYLMLKFQPSALL